MAHDEARTVSVVVPALNEAESLETLATEILAVAERERWDVEVLFVDDGSTDATWETIECLAARDARVRGIRFRRNFGKAAALSAGFAEARGELVFTLDADLQDDPAEMPALAAKLDEGFDLVSGWKRTRMDPWHKVLASRVWNRLVSAFTGVDLHDHNCGLKAYRREVIEEIDVQGEFHRYIPVLADARGFRIGEVEVAHRPRSFGHSKYGASRLLRGWIDLFSVLLFTRYRERPAHMLAGCGCPTFLLGFALYVTGTVLLKRHLTYSFPDGVLGWLLSALDRIVWSLYSFSGLLVSAGLIFTAAGLVAQVVASQGRASARPSYAIADRAGSAPAEGDRTNG